MFTAESSYSISGGGGREGGGEGVKGVELKISFQHNIKKTKVLGQIQDILKGGG